MYSACRQAGPHVVPVRGRECNVHLHKYRGRDFSLLVGSAEISIEAARAAASSSRRPTGPTGQGQAERG